MAQKLTGKASCKSASTREICDSYCWKKGVASLTARERRMVVIQQLTPPFLVAGEGANQDCCSCDQPELNDSSKS